MKRLKGNKNSPTASLAATSVFRKLKRDHFIFFLCLVIAALFWVLIKLSDFYTVSYDFRIQYQQVPLEKRLTSTIDTTLNVNVTARGFALLDMGFGGEKLPLDIDLRNYQIINDQGDTYFIYTQELRQSLAEKLNVDESNIILSKNRLVFVLEPLQSKNVPVVPHYSFRYKDQYDAYQEVKVSPKSVEVFGPATVLDTLKAVHTQFVELADVGDDIKTKLKLLNPVPQLISFHTGEISLELDVERFTESSLMIPVVVKEKAVHIKTFPTHVKVVYKVAQKDFTRVQASQFSVLAITRGVNLKDVMKLHLTLEKSPVSVSNVRLTPSEVEFVIVK